MLKRKPLNSQRVPAYYSKNIVGGTQNASWWEEQIEAGHKVSNSGYLQSF